MIANRATTKRRTENMMTFIEKAITKGEEVHTANCPHDGPTVRDERGRPKKIKCQGQVNIPVYKLIRDPTQTLSIELLCPHCYRYFYVKGARPSKKKKGRK